jgi:hypothetical protein
VIVNYLKPDFSTKQIAQYSSALVKIENTTIMSAITRFSHVVNSIEKQKRLSLTYNLEIKV